MLHLLFFIVIILTTILKIARRSLKVAKFAREVVWQIPRHSQSDEEAKSSLLPPPLLSASANLSATFKSEIRRFLRSKSFRDS